MNCIHCPKNESVCRGLCACCYAQARLKVLEGSATWTQLERAKLSLPRIYKTGGFNIAYQEARPLASCDSRIDERRHCANVRALMPDS